MSHKKQEVYNEESELEFISREIRRLSIRRESIENNIKLAKHNNASTDQIVRGYC